MREPAGGGSGLTLPAPQEARRLRQSFVDANYTEQGLLRLFGVVETPMPHLRNLPRLLDLTREPTLLNTLVRWFLLGLPAARDRARGLFAEELLRTFVESGLLRADGEALTPTALLVPVGPYLVASDLYQKLLSPQDFEHVLTINPPARLLMDFTVRRPSRATLDLCSGSGVQALAAAAHSDTVVATDLNPRATRFAEFSARLNDCEKLRCLTGDAFAPAEGDTFDLIVCNPPFILAPAKRYLYRDSGMELDGFCRSLVRGAPPHLNDGGYFQMILEWVEVKGQPWHERMAAWFEGIGCDVWLLKNYSHDPSWYAHTRLRETPFRSTEADAATYAEWMDYYRRHGVEAIHGGLVAMRRRGGSAWMRIEELPDRVEERLGESVLQKFESCDFLESHPSDESLLRTRLRLAPDLRRDEESSWSDGHWTTPFVRLRKAHGLPQSTGLTADVMGFLSRFDGIQTVGQVIEETAVRAGVDAAQARAECMRVVRLMIDRSFLLA
ncbi:MAG TPA: class I SAM-dependent methyltransferase [Candidatus Polarisedimenticolia bacterium]|nr:class I SAM-dependent methyltransferase [Candidatus Polarisedimenticolia bacterium]